MLSVVGKHSHKLFGALSIGSLAIACAHDLPPEVHDPADFGSDSVPRSLISAMKDCEKRLNGIRDAADSRYFRSDLLTVIGGSTSGAGGLVATIAGAVTSTSAGTDVTKATTIVGAAVAFVGAVVALLSKTVDDPARALNKRTAAEKHYMAGRRALNHLIYQDGDGRRALMQAYAAEQFQDCTMESPSDAVPPLPEKPVAATANADGGSSSVDAGEGDGGFHVDVQRDASCATCMVSERPRLSIPACIAACQALCDRKQPAEPAVVGHFCSSGGEGWRACVNGRCNDAVFLSQ